MSEEAAFDKSLAALSQFFVGERTVLETLDRVAELTTSAIPTAEFVGNHDDGRRPGGDGRVHRS